MQVLRRLRGAFGTAVTWGVAFAIIGALVTVARLFGAAAMPSSIPMLLRMLLWFAFGWGIIGGAIGLVFAGTIAVGERRQTVSSLSTGWFTLAGFSAGALVPILVTAALLIPRHDIAGRLAGTGLRLSLICGVVGAGIAAATLRLARRSSGMESTVDIGARVI
jgi:hypothetical protein